MCALAIHGRHEMRVPFYAYLLREREEREDREERAFPNESSLETKE